jgi:hypothetical protein
VLLVRALFGVLDAGENYLQAIGRPRWRAGLLLERALTHQRLGEWDEAVAFAEEALALYQDGAPGYTLASHRFQLGGILRAAGRPGEAEPCHQAILARYKLGRLTSDDQDGYHRVACPAAMSKIRCPLRPTSMTLDRDRPEILHPPEHPQACCAQQTITVPAEVNAKTRQKHDYPSAAWRRSYTRRRTRLRHRQRLSRPAFSGQLN